MRLCHAVSMQLQYNRMSNMFSCSHRPFLDNSMPFLVIHLGSAIHFETVIQFFLFIKVPLYPGCSIMLKRTVLATIMQSSTATSMARALLVAMFDLPTLLRSNLKGGASKRPGSKNQPNLNKLDETKLQAIYREWTLLKIFFSAFVFEALTSRIKQPFRPV